LLVLPVPIALAAAAACGGDGDVPTTDSGTDALADVGDGTTGPDAGDCPTFNPLKNAYFGDLHEHTAFSADAYSFSTRNTPIDAYAFAKGTPVQIAGASPDGGGPITKIDRPLDFLAVTDHSEFLAIALGCGADLDGGAYEPTSPYYDSARCKLFRSNNPAAQTLDFALLFNNMKALCGDSGQCEPVIKSAWQKEQAAAALAYDRCKFTSFVAYEWTHISSKGDTLHKNVIFGSSKVPDRPFDSITYGTAPELWTALDQGCKASDGCEALTIPHNSNESSGLAFEVPTGAEAQMAKYQRLVEIFQHKGASECLYDADAGADGGAETECAFEEVPSSIANGRDGSFVRDGLTKGITARKTTGANPLEMGIVGATDDHNGAPGNVKESTFPGHVGRYDDDPASRIRAVDAGAGKGNLSFNPGGITGVWSEQNTREAIFAALKRRETWATSGPRIIVRFFATTNDGSDPCADPDFPKQLVAKGATPMGGTFKPGTSKPRLVAYAWKDATDLARIDLIKAWVDGAGQPHERVERIPVSTASKPACVVWDDASANGEISYYYARVLEQPTPRWSSYDCQKAPNANPAGCAPDGALVQPIQERAWTSPIWMVP
jgi:hypothetical protein